MCGGDGAHHCEVGVTMTPLVIGFFFFFQLEDNCFTVLCWFCHTRLTLL